MSQAAQYQGDLVVNGVVYANGFSGRQGTVNDTMIVTPATPSAAIQGQKVQHQYNRVVDLNGTSTATAATVRRTVHVAHGTAGTILGFHVGAVGAAVGGATVTVDLKKNGSSILTSTITLDNSAAAFALVAGSLSASTIAAGDVLEAQITAVSAGGGTLPTGVFCRLVTREDPA